MELNNSDTLHASHSFLSDFFLNFLDFYVVRKKIIKLGNFTTR